MSINLNPVHSINYLLKPLGLTLSTKQQIISKIALASFAMLAINNVVQHANAECYQSCEPVTRCVMSTVQECDYSSPCPQI